MKSCPIGACEEPVPQKNVMCREHWLMVPTGLQKTIWRLWNSGKPLPGHLEACASAIEQVEDALNGRALS